jgi:hypothetical protein
MMMKMIIHGTITHYPCRYDIVKNCIDSDRYYCVYCSSDKRLSVRNGPVVQLVRTPACHAGGRGFESLPDRE